MSTVALIAKKNKENTLKIPMESPVNRRDLTAQELSKLEDADSSYSLMNRGFSYI